jgi:hypothetical protein
MSFLSERIQNARQELLILQSPLLLPERPKLPKELFLRTGYQDHIQDTLNVKRAITLTNCILNQGAHYFLLHRDQFRQALKDDKNWNPGVGLANDDWSEFVSYCVRLGLFQEFEIVKNKKGHNVIVWEVKDAAILELLGDSDKNGQLARIHKFLSSDRIADPISDRMTDAANKQTSKSTNKKISKPANQELVSVHTKESEAEKLRAVFKLLLTMKLSEENTRRVKDMYAKFDNGIELSERSVALLRSFLMEQPDDKINIKEFVKQFNLPSSPPPVHAIDCTNMGDTHPCVIDGQFGFAITHGFIPVSKYVSGTKGPVAFLVSKGDMIHWSADNIKSIPIQPMTSEQVVEFLVKNKVLASA